MTREKNTLKGKLHYVIAQEEGETSWRWKLYIQENDEEHWIARSGKYPRPYLCELIIEKISNSPDIPIEVRQ